MSSSVGAQDMNLEKLRSDAMRGKCLEVFETCKQNMALYTEKITGTGDTVLHMAVSDGQGKLVANMLDFLVLEENNLTLEVESWSVNNVLGAENDIKNTPLHLAAVNGNVEMCKKIGGRDPSLFARRNIAGETPLFLAAFYGRKDAFLWLHHLYRECPGVSSTDLAHCTRDDNDTILHCAIAEGYFDVSIEIVYLYEGHLEEMMRRNKEGLSPLHLLAAKPSAFKTTALLERSFLVHPIYWSLKVRKKNQATTRGELEKRKTREELEKQNSLVKHIKYSLTHDRLFLVLLVFVLLVLYCEPVADNIFTLFSVPVVLLLFFQSGRQRHAGTSLLELQKEKEKHTWLLQIMNELFCHCSGEDMSQIISRTSSKQLSISLQREEFNESESMATPLSGGITIDTPLMIAAKNGVVEMVERVLELFPARIKDVNAEGKNIVLLAVEYRQTEVFRFLCKQKWISQSLFGQVDKEGNNALHLAATLRVDIDWLNPGEINWLEYVENSMPRGLSGRYNRKMKTPEDIFRESHKELLRSEGDWMAKTSQACSVVSTLVLSVGFAKSANEPSGGYPNPGNVVAFLTFRTFSFLAVWLSFLSTIIFLSIVVSRSQSIPSWRYVPLKLCLGMYLMFSSIVCLWISFCAAADAYRPQSDDELSSYFFYSLLIFLPVVTQLPTFFGPILSSIFQIPARRHKATRPIEYRKTKNNQDSTDLNH